MKVNHSKVCFMDRWSKVDFLQTAIWGDMEVVFLRDFEPACPQESCPGKFFFYTNVWLFWSGVGHSVFLSFTTELDGESQVMKHIF